MPKEELVVQHLGAPFRLNITLDVAAFTFYVSYNEEKLSAYTFPSEYLYFKAIRLTGDLNVDYMGFPFVGK